MVDMNTNMTENYSEIINSCLPAGAVCEISKKNIYLSFLISVELLDSPCCLFCADFFLAYSSTMKKGVICSSKKSADFHRTARLYFS
jgi:hypothetical protein